MSSSAFMMLRLPLQPFTISLENTMNLIGKRSTIIEKRPVATTDLFLVIEPNWMSVKVQTERISTQLLMTAHAI